MKIRFLSIVFMIFIGISGAFAHNCHSEIPHKYTFKEQRQIDKFLIETLELSDKQQEELKKNRAAHRKQMNDIIKNMEEIHIKIRNVYYSGIPKFQADIRTAPLKAELVLLKQNANKLRLDHRKTFENILTQEQKIKFEQIRKDIKKTK